MTNLEVNIVFLNPMRVVSFSSISETPENDAWEKLKSWAKPRGYLEDEEKHPIFGFNNPPPSPDQKEYGYEFWIRVEPDFEPEGEIKIEDFPGGLYAVTRCKLHQEVASEFFQKEGYLPSWKKIHDWVESSSHSIGSHRYLEKAINPGAPDEDLEIDVYCTIEA